MFKSGVRRIPLDEVIVGRLPKQLVDAIAEMPITVEEMAEWATSRPEFYFAADKDSVVIHVRARMSAKKAIAAIAGIGSTVGGLIALAQHYSLM